MADALGLWLRLVFSRAPSGRQNVGLGDLVVRRSVVFRLVEQRQQFAVDSLDGLLDAVDEVAIFVAPLEDAGRLVAARKERIRLLDGRPKVIENDDLTASLRLRYYSVTLRGHK